MTDLPAPPDRFAGDAASAAAVPIRPAATVMLVRDGAEHGGGSALEVCLLQRNHGSAFMSGAHLFPGGAVEPADGDDDVAALCVGRTPAEAEAAGGLAYWVASIRETFEEAGLLPARWAHDGSPLRFDGDPAVAARFAEHRRAVDIGERRLAEVLVDEGLRLDLGAVHYVARWITPEGLVRRYDTRFFLTAAPEGQLMAHDGVEAIGGAWHRPGDALEAQAAGAMTMRIPTLASLQMLAQWPTVSDALAGAATIEVETVAPGPLRPGDLG